ncbi:uncharacterized protein G2W53_025564 [Senna tora]|uniref:Uncharacterized protein n=1 Tax=Senna tora TaxID=362788 RepID=A0A834TMH9_9FABA|nr:uncharacterized protein G2W53_025564 [Senna tora]
MDTFGRLREAHAEEEREIVMCAEKAKREEKDERSKEPNLGR